MLNEFVAKELQEACYRLVNHKLVSDDEWWVVFKEILDKHFDDSNKKINVSPWESKKCTYNNITCIMCDQFIEHTKEEGQHPNNCTRWLRHCGECPHDDKTIKKFPFECINCGNVFHNIHPMVTHNTHACGISSKELFCSPTCEDHYYLRTTGGSCL